MMKNNLLILIGLLLLLPFASCKTTKNEVLITTFFREPNGKDGLYLAYSEDAANWIELNNNGKSFLAPTIGTDSIMRDPSICQGPDGTFHMVWTTSWHNKGIGYASSKDLINWSTQQVIPVMEHDSSTKNCWAPEIYYDKRDKLFYIVWASSTDSNPDAPNRDGNNHRMFETHTSDFISFSNAKIMYCPPTMTTIDACFLEKDNKYYMFIKNEDKGSASPMKYIYVESADSFLGNYAFESRYGEHKISPEWVEGPSVFEYNGYVYCIYDEYTQHRYGGVRSKDMKSWEEVPVNMPNGARHGTVFKISETLLEKLKNVTTK